MIIIERICPNNFFLGLLLVISSLIPTIKVISIPAMQYSNLGSKNGPEIVIVVRINAVNTATPPKSGIGR